MSKVVIDASAILALLNKEPGHEIVDSHLPHSIMSTVNLSETLAVLTEIGIAHKDAADLVITLIKEIIPFDEKQAVIAAALRKNTKSNGLSLGDRACLALAKELNLSAVTADKAWANANHSVKVILIR